MTGRILTLRLALATLVGALAATPGAACPPRIAISRPGAAAAPGGGDAFVLVHASRGCVRGALTVTGTAEGLVNGERRSIRLDVAPADADSVYQIRRQWPSGGVWVLRLVVRVGDYGTAGSTATALVGVNAAGEIAAVLQQDPGRRTYPTITEADVDAMLRSLAR
jgi:hypothetical protein